MEWREKMERALHDVTEFFKKGAKNIIIADDRPENWKVQFRVDGEKEWQGVDGPKG